MAPAIALAPVSPTAALAVDGSFSDEALIVRRSDGREVVVHKAG